MFILSLIQNQDWIITVCELFYLYHIHSVCQSLQQIKAVIVLRCTSIIMAFPFSTDLFAPEVISLDLCMCRSRTVDTHSSLKIKVMAWSFHSIFHVLYMLTNLIKSPCVVDRIAASSSNQWDCEWLRLYQYLHFLAVTLECNPAEGMYDFLFSLFQAACLLNITGSNVFMGGGQTSQ